MAAKVLIIVEGSDFDSAMYVLQDLCDQVRTANASGIDFVSDRNSNGTELGVKTHLRRVDIAVPLALFEGLKLESDHPAYPAFANPHVIEGCKYVFFEGVASLADQRFRQSA